MSRGKVIFFKVVVAFIVLCVWNVGVSSPVGGPPPHVLPLTLAMVGVAYLVGFKRSYRLSRRVLHFTGRGIVSAVRVLRG